MFSQKSALVEMLVSAYVPVYLVRMAVRHAELSATERRNSLLEFIFAKRRELWKKSLLQLQAQAESHEKMQAEFLALFETGRHLP